MKFFSPFRPAAHLRPDDLCGLAAHDLPKRRARAMHRHLAQCSVCRAEWEAVQTVWQAAEDTNRMAASLPAYDTLRERIWAALPPPAVPMPERKSVMPIVFVRPLVGASLAATALFGAGMFYGPALVFRAPRAVAFQDVENAMAEIKTATWRETSLYPNHKTKRFEADSASFVWVRLDPPAQVYTSATHEQIPQGHRFLETERGTLSFTPGKRDFFIFDGGGRRKPSAAKLRNRILHSLVFPRSAPAQDAMPGFDEDAPFKWRSTPWKSETATVDNQPVLRFFRHSVRFRDDSVWWKKQTKQEYNLTLFADPQTFRIVRREWEQTAGPGGPCRTVSDHFRYNETPAMDTFTVPAPPVGQPVVITDWTETGIRAKVPDAQKKEAFDLIRRTASARNQNDWQAYSALRDFAYEPVEYAVFREKATETPAQKEKANHDPRQTKTAYRAEVEKNFKSGLPYQKWHINTIFGAGYPMFYVYTRKTENEVFPPTTPPTAFEIPVNLTVSTSPGKPEPQTARFTVTQTEAGLRVAEIRFEGPPRPPMRPKDGLSVEEAAGRAVFGGKFFTRSKSTAKKKVVPPVPKAKSVFTF